MSESPHPLPDQWLSFELRMRQRRVLRCLERAATALDAAHFEDARSALEEARQLQSDSPELASLELRLGALTAVAFAPAPTSEIQSGGLEPPAPVIPPSSSRRWKTLAGVAAGLAVVGTGVAIGAMYWNGRRPDGVATTTPPPVTRPVEMQRAAAAGVATVKQMIARLQIVHETITAAETSPRLLVAEPVLPAYPGPPIAAPEPQPEPEPVVMAVNRGETPPVPEPRSEPRLEPVAPPTAPIDPPGRTVEPAAPSVTAAVRTTPPPASPEEPLVRDETVVRAVLRRYETAYSNLDAEAASVVWPGVNRGALARAFEGLAAQQVSLGSCDVTVSGPAARATCSGSATWQPKVGGGVRTEPRRWSFDLRKNGEAWRIERAVAR
jgi:hypothetical protein